MFTKSSSNAINIITIIAGIGVIIGAAALVIVLSGFAGLKDFTLQFSSFTDPDLKVFPVEGKTLLLTNDQLNNISAIEGVETVTRVVEERVVLNYQQKNEIATLKGVDVSFPQATIDSILAQGRWFVSGENTLVSGWGITNTLGYGIMQLSEPIKVYVPKAGIGQITSLKGAYSVLNATNVGVFQVNEEYDNNYVFTSFETANKLLSLNPNEVSAVEVLIDPSVSLEEVKNGITSVFDQPITIKNRVQLNDALYKMLNTENLAVYLIFTLVLIIALFNVIGAIIMMILDKRRDLKTLFNIGFTVSKAKRIFFYQGLLMTVLGGAIGIILGVVLVFLQKNTGLFKITPSLPYPVELKLLNIVAVFVTIIVLGVIASKIASSRIKKTLIQAS